MPVIPLSWCHKLEKDKRSNLDNHLEIFTNQAFEVFDYVVGIDSWNVQAIEVDCSPPMAHLVQFFGGK
jgi:hypothetical protein